MSDINKTGLAKEAGTRGAIRTNIVQRRGRIHGRGIPDVALWPIKRSTPARRQRKAPDEISELRFKPAYQSLITDVFRLRPHRCTIIPTAPFSENRMEAILHAQTT